MLSARVPISRSFRWRPAVIWPAIIIVVAAIARDAPPADHLPPSPRLRPAAICHHQQASPWSYLAAAAAGSKARWPGLSCRAGAQGLALSTHHTTRSAPSSGPRVHSHSAWAEQYTGEWPAACSAVAARMAASQARTTGSASMSSALHHLTRPCALRFSTPAGLTHPCEQPRCFQSAVAHPLSTRLRRRRGALHVEGAPRADDYRRCGLGSRACFSPTTANPPSVLMTTSR